MKNQLTILAVFIVALCLGSCKKNAETQENLEVEQFKQDQEAKKQILKSGDYNTTDTVNANHHHYSYTIERKALDSLGIVKDEEGYRAYDNAISVVLCQDGGEIFNRTFRKSMFKGSITPEDYEQYILMNIVFDRALATGLRFIISLGVASSDDMFVQYALVVAPDGSSSISPHEVFEADEAHQMKTKNGAE